jgi:outer membrane beta-barrel protein
MRINDRLRSLLLGTLTLLSLQSRADTVEFPDEELATETVLPVFEKVRNVLNRNVQTAGRFEANAGMGLAMNEAFYSNYNIAGNLTYHLDELHAASFSGTYFFSGLNQYGSQLKEGKGLERTGKHFDASKAPVPKWMAFGNYEFTAYYGKISLSKQAVMNLSLFGLAGIGVYQTGTTSNVALDVGFGQNFYVTKQLAVRFDMKLVMYNGPDPTSVDLDTGTNPTDSDFSKDWFYKTYLSLGLGYIF